MKIFKAYPCSSRRKEALISNEFSPRPSQCKSVESRNLSNTFPARCGTLPFAWFKKEYLSAASQASACPPALRTCTRLRLRSAALSLCDLCVLCGSVCVPKIDDFSSSALLLGWTADAGEKET